jgi:hypothetical protein
MRYNLTGALLGCIGLAGLAACDGAGDATYSLALAANPTTVPSGTKSSVTGTVTPTGKVPFVGAVTFELSGCGSVDPASAKPTGGVAAATFTAPKDITENCSATITGAATNGGTHMWTRTTYDTKSITLTVTPPAMSAANFASTDNPANSPATTLVVTPSVTPLTWAYGLALDQIPGGQDRIVAVAITLDVACPRPDTADLSATITPASGSSATWTIDYSGTGVSADTITFKKCDTKPGGTAKFVVSANSKANTQTVSVTGPKKP